MKNYFVYAAVLSILLLAAFTLPNNATFGLTDSERYNSGYNHGCSDGKRGGHFYLDSSGGRSSHTAVFMRGYDSGYVACSSLGGLVCNTLGAVCNHPPTTNNQKFKVHVILDTYNTGSTKFILRVIVYGPHTLNKPTLDKPGDTVYVYGCCHTDAGIYGFTSWKVPQGSKFKACVWTQASVEGNCNWGRANSRSETIHVKVPTTVGGDGDNLCCDNARGNKGASVSISAGSSSPSNGQHYVPDTVTITKGGTVTWTNNDDSLHTVTSGTPEGGNSGTEFDSSFISAGKRFAHVFDSKGTFDYYCTLHPFMKGRVLVK